MATKNRLKTGGDLKVQADGVDASSILEEEFGNYWIKAGRLSGNCIARAFPKRGAKSRGMIAEASGDSETEAIAALKELLEKRAIVRADLRRWDEEAMISVPSREEFIEALGQASLSQTQVALLKSWSVAGEKGLGINDLMKATGYRSPDSALKIMSRAGVLIADYLGVAYAVSDGGNPIAAARVIACCNDAESETPENWIMHEELRTAVWTAL